MVGGAASLAFLFLHVRLGQDELFHQFVEGRTADAQFLRSAADFSAVPFQRLNRAEYVGAVRDLLGLHVRRRADGHPRGGIVVTHVFPLPGTFVTVLTATDDAGQSIVITKSITVTTGVLASFTATAAPSPPNTAHSMNFDGSNSL